uniref:hypothetical protein n=1 Tax=uncultured Polaribacter sp. TaxID=174711 RepID=UPI00261D7EF4|nr:hypothetical protein [uncultured Polaribacter sp.]
MKNFIYLFVFSLMFTLTSNAQKNEESFNIEDAAVVLEANGEYRKNLLLLDLFRKESRFSNGTSFTGQTLYGSAFGNSRSAMQSSAYVSASYTENNSNLNGFNQENRYVSFTPTNRTYLYVDGELIFGNGESRLDKIINVRMKDVKSIVRFNKFDTKIYVTLMDNEEVRY